MNSITYKSHTCRNSPRTSKKRRSVSPSMRYNCRLRNFVKDPSRKIEGFKSAVKGEKVKPTQKRIRIRRVTLNCATNASLEGIDSESPSLVKSPIHISIYTKRSSALKPTPEKRDQQNTLATPATTRDRPKTAKEPSVYIFESPGLLCVKKPAFTARPQSTIRTQNRSLQDAFMFRNGYYRNNYATNAENYKLYSGIAQFPIKRLLVFPGCSLQLAKPPSKPHPRASSVPKTPAVETTAEIIKTKEIGVGTEGSKKTLRLLHMYNERLNSFSRIKIPSPNYLNTSILDMSYCALTSNSSSPRKSPVHVVFFISQTELIVPPSPSNKAEDQVLSKPQAITTLLLL